VLTQALVEEGPVDPAGAGLPAISVVRRVHL
jgi:hypothetical protein